ncbi:hypothetical protein JB92DRAFT_2806879 [Gautieria morchelliformis]|nr:hypothetical protein JB92DRAFT_2806879 [Gautieria morchelliformis]
MEEYDPNSSDLTLAREPLNGYSEGYDLEDDAITVSSRDTASIPRGVPALRIASRPNLRTLSPVLSDDSPPASSLGTASGAHAEHDRTALPAGRGKENDADSQSHVVIPHDSHPQTAVGETPEESLAFDKNSTGVFDRLKQLEVGEQGDYASQEAKRLSQTERGVQWLRDQNVRAIQSMFGALPEPSVSEDTESVVFVEAPDEALVGDLALQQDPRGKYYYTYTSSSNASQMQEEASDPPDGGSIIESGYVSVGHEEPSPRGLAWLADQRAQPSSSTTLNPNPSSNPSPAQIRERYEIHPDIPAEVLKFIPEYRLPLLPPEEVTNCSACGLMLESFRYVCTTCGESEPHSRHSLPLLNGKGKGKDVSSGVNTNPFVYHSHHQATTSPSSSSLTLLSTPDPPPRSSSLLASVGKLNYMIQKPLFASSSQDTLFVPPSGNNPNFGSAGYELCSSCIESAGMLHALEAGVNTSPLSNSPLSSSQEDIRAIIHFRRTLPRSKGHIRHAYREKVWSREGWKDVEQDDISKCSICSTSVEMDRFKCASCTKFDLCRACYSQVHEIHPSHAFLSVPDRSACPCDQEEDAPRRSLDMNGEPSLKHPGVKCHHCMLDIVGARFHCAVCDSVDICSNCESVGLPGNLTSPDGGHDSSHIMIKIPYPLATTEVETASRRAISLWHGRDRPELRSVRRRSSSQDSAHARTVVGRAASGGPHSRHASHSNEHNLPCHVCGISIVGVRYQCASCPSSPSSYNLCSTCEMKSYIVHDPRHIFIKIPRAVDRQIQTPYPLLPPTLYRSPAGFVAGRRMDPRIDPRTYLQSLYHRTAVCDRCIEHIRGVWHHCAYCGSDLCEDCEAMDAHDKTHLFLVFKSMVCQPVIQLNLLTSLEICNIDNPSQSPPLIPHPVYLSS